jgi:hypothetical protein
MLRMPWVTFCRACRVSHHPSLPGRAGNPGPSRWPHCTALGWFPERTGGSRCVPTCAQQSGRFA